MASDKMLRNFLLFCGLGLFLLIFCLLFESLQDSKLSADDASDAEKSYVAPQWKSGFNHKIKVDLKVKNDATLPGQIQSVVFDGRTIPLSQPDAKGVAGFAHFAISPGTYQLKWTVRGTSQPGGVLIQQQREIKISSEDYWIGIVVTQDEVTVKK